MDIFVSMSRRSFSLLHLTAIAFENPLSTKIGNRFHSQMWLNIEYRISFSLKNILIRIIQLHETNLTYNFIILSPQYIQFPIK